MLSRFSRVDSLFNLTSLLLFLFACSALAKDGIPKIKRTQFESIPFDVKYFEDTDVVVVLEQAGKLWRSNDGGIEWHKADNIDQGNIASFWMNPYHKDWAYAFGAKGKHWVTNDKGKSWREFKLPDHVKPTRFRWPLSFHAYDPEKVILKVQECGKLGCEEFAYFTTNGFQDIKGLRKQTRECIWAVGTPQAQSTIKDKADDHRVLCIVQGDNLGSPEENRILITDNYFEDSKEPVTHQGRKVRGFVNVAEVKGYIIAAAKAEGSSELSLMISVNGEDWHQAAFPLEHKIHEEAYTVMESTNYSVQVDVVTTKPWGPMGILFSSDSNGTYFTENIRHTNRNTQGIVDFEKVQGIQGIVMVNVVSNWKEVERSSHVDKKVVSKISFDDGRTWEDMKDGDGKRIHLHSVTEMSNSGKVFSSPAPGLVMGVGNTGDSLKGYGDGDLWVSDNAGLTWSKALKEAHKYEFGDQGTILVAVYDEGPTTDIQYSLNHGGDWSKAVIDKEKVRAGYLTTVPDSTTQKFILQATGRDGDDPAFYLYSLDFTGIYSDKCKDNDFEDWHARLDSNGKPDCLMGHTQTYRRRKKDAKCYVGEKFKEAMPVSKNCECTDEDYECAFNYVPQGEGKDKTCEPKTALKAPENSCKDGKGRFKSPSGFRLIPGNTCRDGVKKDEQQIERPCEAIKDPVTPDGKVRLTATTFGGSSFEQKVYLERSATATGTDETLVMSVGRSSGSVAGMFVSRDHGKQWKRIFDQDENFQAIIKHQYHNDRVFFISPNSKAIAYSINRMDSVDSFDAPAPMNVNGVAPLGFHPDKPEYLIWTGAEHCGSLDRRCHNVAWRSTDRGADWNVLARYTGKCEFIERKGRGQSRDLIYCEQKENEELDGKLQLRSSEDLGGSFQTKIEDILAFATMSEFIIVAEKDPDSNLKLVASIDGQNFAHAQFPNNFNVPVQTAYTVLDSSTHAIFLHVTTTIAQGFEYGRIVKSNSNGTFYVTSLDYVNRDTAGFVDFEKMQGVEGVAMVNIVANPEDADSGKAKKLRSLISHNDGAQWAPLHAPEENPEGDGWGCDVGKPDECSLHLHSYTERDDARDTFSSSSAVGLMLGVGSVGKYLADINDKDNTYTFVSRDAGISWKVAKKGRYMWEYGDQGSLIVIVERSATNFGYYSTDEGQSWARFEFTKDKISILDLTTTPSDNSKSFIIWFRNGDNEIGTINLDFTATRDDRLCKIDEEHNHENDDYYLWHPKHPLQNSDCLFGKKMQYLRKKPDANCWNGPQLEKYHGESTPCECARQDFEW